MPETDAADLALIERVAREGAEIAMRYWRHDPQTWMKGGTSPVSEADLAVDAHLREALLKERPDYGWLSEEADDADVTIGEGRGVSFIADPIDGTRAYLEGQRTWGVAIAVVRDGRPVAGALACPALDKFYDARVGGGARCNGSVVVARGAVERPRMAGPKMWRASMPDDYTQSIEAAAYVPSLAYRIALVADGGLDGTFIRPSAHDWDLAASDVILGEAGGALLRSDGEPPRYGQSSRRHGMLVAGSAAQLPQMLGIVRRTPN